ncbi:MAG: hypothetical protein ACFCGT_13290 [Sandaracinaceae bacterium]
MRRIILLSSLAVLGAACEAAPRADRPSPPTMTTPAFTGRWTRIPGSACGETYPDLIAFEAHGTYRGHRDPAGTFTLWDAGTFEILGATRARLTTATDMEVTYEYDLSADGDVLTFVDAEGCRWSYRRAG